MAIPAAKVPIPSFTSTWHQNTYSSINPKNPSLSARGKNVFITGGSSGIGARTVQSFAEAGAKQIGILGRREKELLGTKEAVNAEYPDIKVFIYIADVTMKDEIDAAFSTYLADAGKIDILIHNAGYGTVGPAIKDATVDEWMSCVEINMKGSFLVTQAFLRSASSKPVLIYVSSIASCGPTVTGTSPYCASKAGAVRFFECLQVEHPEIRVVSIHPGLVDTPMSRKAGSPKMDDVSLPADFMVWLASPEAAFTKGKYLFVNWDVDEMKARADEISSSGVLQMWIDSLPHKN